MEEKPKYIVDITPEGEIFYFELIEYIHKTHSIESANRKSDEILAMAISLAENPHRGRIEERLNLLG